MNTLSQFARNAWLVGCALTCMFACGQTDPTATRSIHRLGSHPFVRGAREQLRWGTSYNPEYRKIAYPGGDVPKNQGVCTDVVVRALRAGGVDLQLLIHQDMLKHWSRYPRYPGVTRPDTNIDHRRVPNHRAYLAAHAQSLAAKKDWMPGDLVYWKLDNGLDHCGVVTDRKGPSGNWMVIHNLSSPEEEDCLRTWTITDHFRVTPLRP